MSAAAPHLFTKTELAEYLQVAEKTVDRLCKAGRLPFVQLPSFSGRRQKGGIRFDARDIDAWVKSYRVMTGCN